MESIVGKDSMSKEDIGLLDFAESVEKNFINQEIKRTLDETLEIGSKILEEAGLI
jgi:vacuolar-type H+-ATPase subunit B/Vma2